MPFVVKVRISPPLFEEDMATVRHRAREAHPADWKADRAEPAEPGLGIGTDILVGMVSAGSWEAVEAIGEQVVGQVRRLATSYRKGEEPQAEFFIEEITEEIVETGAIEITEAGAQDSDDGDGES